METNQCAQNELCNNEVKSFLSETARWAKFLSIVGFVGLGLFVIMAVVMMAGVAAFASVLGATEAGLMGVIYILLAVVYFFPVLYLYRFSVSIKNSLEFGDEAEWNNGFMNLKKTFKFMGVFTIVILSIYVLALLIAIPVMFFVTV